MIRSGLVDKQKMSEQVLNILRKNIMLGEIKAGTHLKENSLSKELGISRGPLREAMIQLENEGLVTTPANGRSIVVGFSNQDVENLYNTRILIEKYAVSLITKEAIISGEKELQQCVALMENALKNGERDVNSDMLFHFILIRLTGNKSLIQTWRSLNGLIKTLIHVTSHYHATRHKEIISDHTKIVEFLKFSEINRAQLVLENHLTGAREYYKEAISQISAEGRNL